MKTFYLTRVSLDPKFTAGVLAEEGRPFAVTLERPWENNARNVSCIPPGTYPMKRVKSPKFGNTFEITQVLNRSAILFHKGNTISDSQGCVLVAANFSTWTDGQLSVANSGAGYNEFMKRLEGVDEAVLVVREV